MAKTENIEAKVDKIIEKHKKRKHTLKAHEIVFDLDEENIKIGKPLVAMRLTNIYGKPFTNLPSFHMPMSTFKQLLEYRGGEKGDVFKDLENAVRKSIKYSATKQ